MKLTFECKLTMFYYISDDDAERIRTKEEIAEALAEYIKVRLIKSGDVLITDTTLTKEDGEQHG